MDSPQLLHLALLLLALAAPRPNIATVGPAEGTEDSSTEVSVFRCKDCHSCACKTLESDFEKFKKIADTQNEIFSDEIIELVTDKTHTTVCFEEPDFCHERIYGVFWQKPEGSGISCGILSSGENGRGGISTEQKTVCCEAETDIKKYNPELKCFYTEMSRPKLNTLPDEIPGEGIPGSTDVPTCKTSIGISIAVLVVVIVEGLSIIIYCCYRHRDKIWPKAPRQQDRQASEGQNIPLQERPSTRDEN